MDISHLTPQQREDLLIVNDKIIDRITDMLSYDLFQDSEWKNGNIFDKIQFLINNAMNDEGDI